MSQNITNNTNIKYNEEILEINNPLNIRVEPNMKIYKYATTDRGRFNTTGIIGEVRKVTYDILLINYSSKDFTDVVINDVISLSDEVDISKVTYIESESMYENGAANGLPNIQFNVGTLAKESQLLVHYTLQFSDEIPIGIKIKNKSKVNYNENTNKTEEDVLIPIEADEIELTIDYTSTKIEAKKIAPSSVLCGENFDFNLIFENVGLNIASQVSISDNLPKGFIVKSVKVINGSETLERGTNYNYDENANPLVIYDVGNFLDIAPKEKLIVTINGNIPYIYD